MRALSKIPLILLPAILVHALLLGGGNSAQILAEFSLPSGATFSLRWYELILAVGLIALYGEVLKSTIAGAGSVIDHALSLALFIALLLEMLLVGLAADPAIFLLVLLSLFDVVAAFTVSIAVARRDVGFMR